MERVKNENIQRRATKLLPELQDKSYSERLRILRLQSLEYHRHRADMIQTYQIFNNIDKVDRNKIFKQYETSIMPTRGHKFKIIKPHCKSNARKNTFSVRVRSIKPWNNLPEELVTTNGVNSFKNILNKVWRNSPLKFNPECNEPKAGNEDTTKKN